MTLNRNLAIFAALNGALAVVLGAFSAHGAGPQVKILLNTGAQYQMVHALLGLVCAVWPGQGRLLGIAGWLACAGGLIFSLALACIALLSLRMMGGLAPVGGLLMIAGWLLLAFAMMRPAGAGSLPRV